LYQAYAGNLKKAVSGVLQSGDYGSAYFDMQKQFEANLSRFAAFKAGRVTELLQEYSTDTVMQRAILNTFNRYQAAEYNTAIARARTAKQWTDFTSDEVSNELYPNIKWLPSRSAVPREEHRVFWNQVWAKDDPFWNTNQPGNLWNCSCDWEITDEPVTIATPNDAKPKAGLEGNPADTGQIFSDNASYFKGSNKQNKAIIRAYRELETDHLLNNHNASGDLVDYKNTQSGKVLDSEKAYERMLAHCYGEEQFAAARAIPHNFQNLRNPREESLGERKGNGKKDKKNRERKEKRGVTGYVWYDWEVRNKTFTGAMERHTNGFEQIYALYKKREPLQERR
jgi:hypothetical protein